MNNSFKVGDIVSRKKYGNDILFKIDKIEFLFLLKFGIMKKIGEDYGNI